MASIGPHVFAVTDGGAAFRSSDKGDSRILAGTAFGGMYSSPDSGISCRPINTGMGDVWIKAIAANGNRLFAGTPRGIFRSIDNGTSWQGSHTGLADTDILALAVNGGTLFAGTGMKGLYRSEDNGGTRTRIDLEWTRNRFLIALGSNDGNLFAVVSFGLYRSSDNGVSWTRADMGLPSPVNVSSHVRGLSRSRRRLLPVRWVLYGQAHFRVRKRRPSAAKLAPI